MREQWDHCYSDTVVGIGLGLSNTPRSSPQSAPTSPTFKKFLNLKICENSSDCPPSPPFCDFNSFEAFGQSYLRLLQYWDLLFPFLIVELVLVNFPHCTFLSFSSLHAISTLCKSLSVAHIYRKHIDAPLPWMWIIYLIYLELDYMEDLSSFDLLII